VATFLCSSSVEVLSVICHWTSFCRPKYFGLLLHYAPLAEVAQNSSQSEFMTDCPFIPLNNLSVEITVSFSLILHYFFMCQFLCCVFWTVIKPLIWLVGNFPSPLPSEFCAYFTAHAPPSKYTHMLFVSFSFCTDFQPL